SNQPKRAGYKEMPSKSHKSKKGAKAASNGKEASLKSSEPKSKNPPPKGKTNASRPEGKSLRKPKPGDNVVEILQKVISSTNGGTKADITASSPSPVKVSNTRSILPTPKVRPKMVKKV